MLTTELGEQLRQGDVCSVRSFPRWTVDSSKISTGNAALLAVEAWDKPLISDDGERLVIVCSYCCDIENPRGRAGILLAPLMKVPASPGSEQEAGIMASDIRRDGQIGFLNLFPLSLPAEPDSQPAVADFSAMATLAPVKDAIAVLTATRRFTMTPAMRLAFKEKLALFLYRPGDED